MSRFLYWIEGLLSLQTALINLKHKVNKHCENDWRLRTVKEKAWERSGACSGEVEFEWSIVS